MAPGIAVSPLSDLTTTESGGTSEIAVELTASPAGEVVIDIASSDLTEGVVSTAQLLFDATNWNVLQVVTVAGVDDDEVDGEVDFQVSLSAASSVDPRYAALAPVHVSLTNQDDDLPAQANTIYVDEIWFDQRRRGRHGTEYRVMVAVREDSNGDGFADTGDLPIAGVEVTVRFAGKSFTGITDQNGQFATDWLKNIPSDDYYANVDLALVDYVYQPLDLDREDDSDGDGLPDALLSI